MLCTQHRIEREGTGMGRRAGLIATAVAIVAALLAGCGDRGTEVDATDATEVPRAADAGMPCGAGRAFVPASEMALYEIEYDTTTSPVLGGRRVCALSWKDPLAQCMPVWAFTCSFPGAGVTTFIDPVQIYISDASRAAEATDILFSAGFAVMGTGPTTRGRGIIAVDLVPDSSDLALYGHPIPASVPLPDLLAVCGRHADLFVRILYIHDESSINDSDALRPAGLSTEQDES